MSLTAGASLSTAHELEERPADYTSCAFASPKVCVLALDQTAPVESHFLDGCGPRHAPIHFPMSSMESVDFRDREKALNSNSFF